MSDIKITGKDADTIAGALNDAISLTHLTLAYANKIGAWTGGQHEWILSREDKFKEALKIFERIDEDEFAGKCLHCRNFMPFPRNKDRGQCVKKRCTVSGDETCPVYSVDNGE